MTNVDTALGAAVTIGFSLAILRLTSQTLRQHKDIKNHYGEHNLKRSWFVSFVQAILIRTLFQKGIEKDSTNKALQEGDAYFSILRNSMKISQDDVEGIYVGSCHCQSIGYTVRFESLNFCSLNFYISILKIGDFLSFTMTATYPWKS